MAASCESRTTVAVLPKVRPSPAAYWKRSTAELEKQRKRYPAILSLTPDAARQLQSWCATTPVKRSVHRKEPEGWITLQANFDAEEQARFLILGFGSRARVIEPRELRQWVRAEVAATVVQE